MSEGKHTPGPWRAVRFSDGFRIAFNEVGCWIAEVFRDDDVECRVDADARLIAAAPDMLEALEALRDACIGFVPECAAQVDAAISKAKGINSDE